MGCGGGQVSGFGCFTGNEWEVLLGSQHLFKFMSDWEMN